MLTVNIMVQCDSFTYTHSKFSMFCHDFHLFVMILNNSYFNISIPNKKVSNQNDPNETINRRLKKLNYKLSNFSHNK